MDTIFEMIKFSVDGFTIEGLGEPAADVFCPHGEAVVRINFFDYSRPVYDQVNEVTLADFHTAVREEGFLACSEYCGRG